MQTGTLELHEAGGELLAAVELSGAGIEDWPPPIITSFTPTFVLFGDLVTISGQNFNEVLEVTVEGLNVEFNVMSDTAISFNATVVEGGYITVTTFYGMATSDTPLIVQFGYPEMI